MKTGRLVVIIATLLGLGVFSFQAALDAKQPVPEKRIHRYSVTRGEPLDPPSRKTRIPLVVYGDLASKQPPFIPSGYMGDARALSMSSVYESAPLPAGKQGQNSLKISYKIVGSEGWAGIYWLAPANNWGRVKGGGLDLTKAHRLTFWVRGEKGGEVIDKFSVGGVTAGPYPDSDEASIGPLRLSQDWEQYSIDLTGKDLRHIIGGFSFVIRRIDNKHGATFFVDEIIFEGIETPEDETAQAGSAAATSTATVNTPASVSASVAPPVVEIGEESADSKTAVAAAKSPIRRVIPFSTAFNVFDGESKKILGEFVQLAATQPDATIVVEGHTDSVGPASTNLKLSKERAMAVADYLADQGIKKERLIVIGYGEDRPISPHSNETPDGRKKNRRIEMVLIP